MADSVPLSPSERALKVVLRVNGVVTSLAVLAVFMPLEWMDWTHRYLGMGPIPNAPVFEYLARTVSFMYFIHGTLCLMLSRDVRRFGPVITYVAVIEMIFAGLLFWIAGKAGMPRAWTWTEAPIVIGMAGLILGLRLAARRGELRAGG